MTQYSMFLFYAGWSSKIISGRECESADGRMNCVATKSLQGACIPSLAIIA
jgi:hypothetical protein